MSRRLLALPILTTLLLGSCTFGGRSPEETRATSLAGLDTTGMVVERTLFCEDIPDEAVTAALGAKPRHSRTWSDGDTITPAPDVRAPGNEIGCAYEARDGARASAWVFAPPVSRQWARTLVDKLRRARGCTPLRKAPAFGQPSLARLCHPPRTPAGTRRVSYHGLFGDAWLSCQLTLDESVPRRELLARADQWCLAVLRAASAD